MNRTDASTDIVSDWLHADAEHRVPEHLDAVLRRTRTERQRPAWSSLERWLPVEPTLASHRPPGSPGCWSSSADRSPRCCRSVRSARASAPGAVRPGAQRRHRLGHDGDIYAVDPVTHAERLLVGGETFDFGPGFSRDGTKFMFLRGAGDAGDDEGLSLVVANADGTAIRELTPSVQGLDWIDWSPDSKQIVFLSRKTAKAPGVINVVNVDGSGLTTLDVGKPAHFVSWLPPLGGEIVFRAEQDTPTGGAARDLGGPSRRDRPSSAVDADRRPTMTTTRTRRSRRTARG